MNLSLFENHDEAYFIWKELGVKNETLIHIDAHLDFDWIHKQSPQELFNANNIGTFKNLLQTDIPFNLNDEEAQKRWIHIGNYIYPAMQEGLVKKFYWVLPDPIWKGPERRLIKNDLAHNFKKHHKGTWRMEDQGNLVRFAWEDKEMIALGLEDLPTIEEPVLLDIDVDFLLTHTIFALSDKEQMTRRFPWVWPSELVKTLQKLFVSKVTTIAYSVEGGYTPIAYKFLGDELKEILTNTHSPQDPFYSLRRQAIESQQKKEWSQAIKLLLQAKNLRPQDPSIAWTLAENYWELKDKANAAKYHQLAVLLDPSYKTPYNSNGIRLEMLKDRKKALKEFEKIMERDPLDPQAKCSAAWQHVFYKRFETAFKLFREAAALDESCGDAHLGLGYLWMKQKKWEEAKQAFEKAIQYKTYNKAVHYWLGLVLEKQGRLQESIQQYNQFIRLGRHNIGVGLKLTWGYWRQGAIYKAKWEMERLLRVLKSLMKLRLDYLDWHWRKFKWRLESR